jgi:hypothetical protein
MVIGTKNETAIIAAISMSNYVFEFFECGLSMRPRMHHRRKAIWMQMQMQ